MLDTIEKNRFREKSLNYIAPSKALTMEWCKAAWDGITKETIVNGARRCFMDPADLDEGVAQYDGVDIEAMPDSAFEISD